MIVVTKISFSVMDRTSTGNTGGSRMSEGRMLCHVQLLVTSYLVMAEVTVI